MEKSDKNRRKPGASERLQAALDEANYPDKAGARTAKFAEDFGVAESTAQNMMTADHTPWRGNVLETVAEALGISPAYWMFGIDEYVEDIVVDVHSQAWIAMLDELNEVGKKPKDFPARLLKQLARLIYEQAMQNKRRIDRDYVTTIVELTLSLQAEN